MAAHYGGAHNAVARAGCVSAKVLDDGSKVVQHVYPMSFPSNDEGWFVYPSNRPFVFRPIVGGRYFLDIQKIGDSELRFGVRQLGRGPSRHRLASAAVRFGPADGTCFQYPLSRALAADERLLDDALCAGTPPAVVRVDPALLAPALVLSPALPRPPYPWKLIVSVTLVFQVVKDA